MSSSDDKSRAGLRRWIASLHGNFWWFGLALVSCVAVGLAGYLTVLAPGNATYTNNGECNAQGGKNSVSCSTSNGEAASLSQQALYAATLRNDYQSFDRGVFSYSKIGNLKTAAIVRFKATVTDAGRGEQLAPLQQFDGMTVYPADVPTGGIVGVQIVTCENLICQSLSDLKQPVLLQGEHADWYWNIIAGVPGHAVITLRVDTYDQGSTQTLSSEIINIDVNIVSTPAFTSQQNQEKIANAAKGITGDIETIGSIATAIVAVGGIIGWLAVKRRKRRGGKDTSSDKASEGNAPPSKPSDEDDKQGVPAGEPAGNKPSGTGWPS